jgi:NADH:ubiquinone oxidoreductase subunit 4 (subunit M)
MDPFRAVPGPWPWLLSPAAAAAEFDPAGPLAMVVLLPLLGAFVAPFVPLRHGRLFARTAFLWALPGAAFLLAAAWFGAGGEPGAVRWLERLPGGGGLVLSPWNLVPALALGLVAPLALALPEPREWEPERSGWMLALLAASQAALLAAGPALAAFGWMGGAWALFFLLGHQDASGQGGSATAPFVLHAAAAACVFIAGLVPGFMPLLAVAAAIRLGIAPFHGTWSRIAELLPTGAFLLAGVAFLTTGVRAAHDGLFAIARDAAAGEDAALAAQGAIAVLAAVATLWGGLVALPQEDLRGRIAGTLSTLSALWLGLLALLPPAEARAAVGGWALVVLVAFVAVLLAYARLWAFTRTGDLRAYGGLARIAHLRAGLLALTVSALVAAPLLAAGGRPLVALARAVAGRPLVGLALAAGAGLGALGLGLAVYRTLRGMPPTPIEAPDLRGLEWLFVATFALALLFLAALEPPLGGLGGLWPAWGAEAGR